MPAMGFHSVLNPIFIKVSIEGEIQKAIEGIVCVGKAGNLLEILGYDQVDFQKGFDLAIEMQNRDLVKLLYSNFNQNKIIVEITLVGKAAYEAQSA